MTTVTIVYHSGYGHTRVQAEAVRDGASSVDGTTVWLVPVEEIDANWHHLDEADALIFGTPTYMAGPSAQFKAFLDSTSGRWAEQAWRDKLAAGFTNSASHNGDKLATLENLALVAMQHGMMWIGLGLMPGNNSSTGSPEDLNRLGGFIGAMAQSDADVGPDVAPGASDRRTAAHLGRRVAESAARWKSGLLATAGARA